MTKAKLSLTLFLIAMVLVAMQVPKVLTHLRQSKIDALQSSLQSLVSSAQQQNQLPSLAMSVSVPGMPMMDFVAGNISEVDHTPITVNNLFQVGSITKTFTAAIILQLEQEGKLNIHDPIGKYLPQYPQWRDITIQQLLWQNSGLFEYDSIPNFFINLAQQQTRVWQPDEMLKIAYQHPAYFAPGEGWHYANTNYMLLGLIIEKVTGQSYQTEISQRLIQPLGLSHTYYYPGNAPVHIQQQMAHGYYNQYDMTFENGSWRSFAGALISNPHDILVWYQALLSGQVLAKQQTQELLDFISTDTGKPDQNYQDILYGLSIFRMNTPQGVIYFTPGLTSGYRSMVSFMPCTGLALSFTMTQDNLPHISGKLLMDTYQTLLASAIVQQYVANYQDTHTVPAYCANAVPAKAFVFPKI